MNAVVQRTFELRNSQGLHVRPAAMLAELARRYQCDLKIVADGETVDARSIMGLMALGLPHGSRIELIAEGPDEQAALLALAELIDSGFGET